MAEQPVRSRKIQLPFQSVGEGEYIFGDGVFNDCPRLTVVCSMKSCARKYCIENDIHYRKYSSLPLLIPLLVIIAALVAAAALQLTGTFDILGWLRGLLGI